MPASPLPQFVPTQAWWKECTVYQVYPSSFCDSDGDGVGDLKGIMEKLPYLKDLGVDVIWLNPVYKSPWADGGYDISDYQDINPKYGTLADWDALLKQVHDCGMKLIMDLVLNHTSDEHEWFTSSRSSKTSPKRDWYIWRPSKRREDDGSIVPPNNWSAIFQGSAWENDDATDESYLHLFISKQPDLNWENPDVREAACDLMNFWVDKGCDGFRLDVINFISKAPGLPDAPVTVAGEVLQPASVHFANGPRVHEFLKEMHQRVMKGKDLLTVGETPLTYDKEELAAYVLPENEELNMVFQFELMFLDSPAEGGEGDINPLKTRPWTLDELRTVTGFWQKFKRDQGFWNAIFIENHDHARAVSRFGNDSEQWRSLSAKLLGILQVAQSGTLFLYQGQELGLKNFPKTWGIEEYKDVATLNYFNRMLKKRREEQNRDDVDTSDLLLDFAHNARDHARVPMQWDSSRNAGFTTGTPWMRVNDDYQTWNVETEKSDPTSPLNFYKAALAIRKAYSSLIYGDYEDVSVGHQSIFAFVKSLPHEQALIVLNFSPVSTEWSLDGWGEAPLVLGNYSEPCGHGHIRAYEGRIYVTSLR